MFEWFGHGVVVGVVVEGLVVLELAGVVVVLVEAAPDITVPRPSPSPRVLPAMPAPNRNFLRDDATLCSFGVVRPPTEGSMARPCRANLLDPHTRTHECSAQLRVRRVFL